MPRSQTHRREHMALIGRKGGGPKTGPQQKSCNIVYAAWLSRDSSFCYARGAGLVSSAGFRYVVLVTPQSGSRFSRHPLEGLGLCL